MGSTEDVAIDCGCARVGRPLGIAFAERLMETDADVFPTPHDDDHRIHTPRRVVDVWSLLQLGVQV
jgi:hypothetical protein